MTQERATIVYAKTSAEWQPGYGINLYSSETMANVSIEPDLISLWFEQQIDIIEYSINLIGEARETYPSQEHKDILDSIVEIFSINKHIYAEEKSHNKKSKNYINYIKNFIDLVESGSLIIPSTNIGKTVFNIYASPILHMNLINFSMSEGLTNIQIFSGIDLSEKSRSFLQNSKIINSENSISAIRIFHSVLWEEQNTKEIEENFINTTITLQEQIATLQQQMGERKIEEDKSIKRIKSTITEANKAKREMLNAKEQFLIDNELDPAADWWEKAAKFNNRLAIAGLVLFFCTGALIAIVAYWIISTLFIGNAVVNIPQAIEITNLFKDLPWYTPLVLTVPSIFIIWILKHFSRVFVQSFNLSNDARHRMALTKVYADIASSNDLTEEQKNMVFAAMFKGHDNAVMTPDIDPNFMASLLNATKKG